MKYPNLLITAAIMLPFALAANGTAIPKPGTPLSNGTILVNDDFVVASRSRAIKDPKRNWRKGREYCDDSNANGREDWKLPSARELNIIYKVKGKKKFKGTFNDGYYMSDTQSWDNTPAASAQNFSDGLQVKFKKKASASIVCVAHGTGLDFEIIQPREDKTGPNEGPLVIH